MTGMVDREAEPDRWGLNTLKLAACLSHMWDYFTSHTR
jgi:hypothetical protein